MITRLPVHLRDTTLRFVFALAAMAFAGPVAFVDIDRWERDWPNTDFSKHSADLAEIFSGGICKDLIRAIDSPTIGSIAAGRETHADREPVIRVTVNGKTRGYPLSVLIWHEIVNDELGGVPIAVTYCPLCNTAIVFDRRVDDRVLDFGTTGNLRFSDLVMYDRQTDSWWQQFTGEGIVGAFSEARLTIIPSRVEPFGVFAAAFPDADILQRPPGFPRNYGVNADDSYDTGATPLFPGIPLPEGVAPMAYVVAVGDQAWAIDLLREKKRVEAGDLVLTWEPGQLSVLDGAYIKENRDIRYVTVQRKTPAGMLDAAHDMTFAFAFNDFKPDGTLHQ